MIRRMVATSSGSRVKFSVESHDGDYRNAKRNASRENFFGSWLHQEDTLLLDPIGLPPGHSDGYHPETNSSTSRGSVAVVVAK